METDALRQLVTFGVSRRRQLVTGLSQAAAQSADDNFYENQYINEIQDAWHRACSITPRGAFCAAVFPNLLEDLTA